MSAGKDNFVINKTIILGDKGGGKTSLAERSVNNVFRSAEFNFNRLRIHMVGVQDLDRHDVLVKNITLEQVGKIGTYIRDFGLDENEQPFLADTAIICYDITNAESFENAKKWIEETNIFALSASDKEYIKSNPNSFGRIKTSGIPIPKILVGCKSDLADKREVETSVAREFAEKEGMRFFECSVKKSVNYVGEKEIAQIFKATCEAKINAEEDYLKFNMLKDMKNLRGDLLEAGKQIGQEINPDDFLKEFGKDGQEMSEQLKGFLDERRNPSKHEKNNDKQSKKEAKQPHEASKPQSKHAEKVKPKRRDMKPVDNSLDPDNFKSEGSRSKREKDKKDKKESRKHK